MELTNKKSPGGGNTKWEEGNLKKWSHSELRFVEVSEHICDRSRKAKGDQECLAFFGDHEEFLEEWFFSEEREEEGLRRLLCEEEAKVCCPKGHYGKKCSLCPAMADAVPCNGHGSCDGDGTRKGPLSFASHFFSFLPLPLPLPSPYPSFSFTFAFGFLDCLTISLIGNGSCLCSPGWTGDECDQCAARYFFDEETRNCTKCHEFCKGFVQSIAHRTNSN